MLKEIKEGVYDWYVLGLRQFYRCWIEKFWKRWSIPRDLPYLAYKQMILDISPLGVSLEEDMDGVYMNSLRRYCRKHHEKALKKLKLERMISNN